MYMSFHHVILKITQWWNYSSIATIHLVAEVGVSVYEGQKLIYTPQYERKLKTINENITIGFFTRKKGGILMQLADDLEVSSLQAEKSVHSLQNLCILCQEQSDWSVLVVFSKSQIFPSSKQIVANLSCWMRCEDYLLSWFLALIAITKTWFTDCYVNSNISTAAYNVLSTGTADKWAARCMISTSETWCYFSEPTRVHVGWD